LVGKKERVLRKSHYSKKWSKKRERNKTGESKSKKRKTGKG